MKLLCLSWDFRALFEYINSIASDAELSLFNYFLDLCICLLKRRNYVNSMLNYNGFQDIESTRFL